ECSKAGAAPHSKRWREIRTALRQSERTSERTSGAGSWKAFFRGGACIGTTTAFRPYRARCIRLASYLGFRFAPPQAITLRVFSPGTAANNVSLIFAAGKSKLSAETR